MAQMTPEDLQHLAEEVLAAQGFSQPQGAAIAAMMVAGQRDDCASHGIYRLLGIVKTLKAGKVVPDAEPTIEDVAPAIVRVDAGGGFSPLAFETGLPLLDAKARSCGLAALAINNCVHFSALWVEMEALTARGLVAQPAIRPRPMSPRPVVVARCSVPIPWPSAGRGPRVRPSSSISPPAPWPAAKSNCIVAQARPCPRAGGWMPRARPATMPAPCWRRAPCSPLAVTRARRCRP